MDQGLKNRLLVTYGYMQGLNGKPVGSGSGLMGGVERLYVPSEIMKPLEELLFPKTDKGLAEKELADYANGVREPN